MPYRNKRKQQAYTRNYMKRKRALDHIAKLKRDQQQLAEEYRKPHAGLIRFLDPFKEIIEDYDKEIMKLTRKVGRLNGLLGNIPKCPLFNATECYFRSKSGKP